MDTCPGLEFAFGVFPKANLFEHIDTVGCSSISNKREIERISVVSCHNRRASFSNVLEPATDERGLQSW